MRALPVHFVALVHSLSVDAVGALLSYSSPKVQFLSWIQTWNGKHAPLFEQAIIFYISYTCAYDCAHTCIQKHRLRKSGTGTPPYPVARGRRCCLTILISCANSIVLARPVTRRQRLNELVLVFLQGFHFSFSLAPIGLFPHISPPCSLQ